MNILSVIILGALIAAVASVIFWLLSFKFTATKVEFSNIIAKGKDAHRIKLINSGYRDLIDVSFLIEVATPDDIFYLGSDVASKTAVLRGRRHQYRIRSSCPHLLALHLDGVFDKHDGASITVHTYGYDATTGARQMFTSPVYTNETIKLGSFKPSGELVRENVLALVRRKASELIERTNYRRHIADTLSFVETKTTKSKTNKKPVDL